MLVWGAGWGEVFGGKKEVREKRKVEGDTERHINTAKTLCPLSQIAILLKTQMAAV